MDRLVARDGDALLGRGNAQGEADQPATPVSVDHRHDLGVGRWVIGGNFEDQDIGVEPSTRQDVTIDVKRHAHAGGMSGIGRFGGTHHALQSGLDSAGSAINNARMVLRGRVQNGVVVLEGNPKLPEGAVVTVSYPTSPAEPTPTAPKQRIQVPLVRTSQPGSVHLTGERIGEILDAEDVSPRR
jgi:hypothetical protein